MRLRWINWQSEIFRRLPPDVGVVLGNLRHLPSLVHWWFHPLGRSRALELLAPLEGRYQGCRCVVIGNGPSLKRMKLSPLVDEFTFGMNRIYLMSDSLGFEPTFYAAINRYVLEQFADEINTVQSLKFLNWSYRDRRISDPRTVYLETKPTLRPDGRLLSGYYAGGGTVTLLALQLAYFMGFSEAILIGVDHSYAETGTPNKAVRAVGDDSSHFSKAYFGAGVVWQLPDLAAMERGYAMIRRLYEGSGRRIVDATKDGRLNVFPKVGFEEALSDVRWTNRSAYAAQHVGEDAHRHS
jgi:hypothetical protein